MDLEVKKQVQMELQHFSWQIDVWTKVEQLGLELVLFGLFMKQVSKVNPVKEKKVAMKLGCWVE